MNAPDPTDDRSWSNYVVAQAARAATGLISPGIRAMGCVPSADVVELHFAIPGITPSDQEDISDIVFELDVLLDGHVEITTTVHDGAGLDWRAIEPVYGSKQEE